MGSSLGRPWESSCRSLGAAIARLGVDLADDGVAHLLQLLLAVLVLILLRQLVGVQPRHRLVHLRQDGVAILVGDLVLELVVLDGRLHVEAIRLQAVLGSDRMRGVGRWPH